MVGMNAMQSTRVIVMTVSNGLLVRYQNKRESSAPKKVIQSKKTKFLSPFRSAKIKITKLDTTQNALIQAPGPAPRVTCAAKVIIESNDQKNQENACGFTFPKKRSLK